MSAMGNLVSTAWLAEHLGEENLVILDASWHLPAAKRDAKAEFLARRIPAAQFFDLDATADPNTTLPHMLPPPGKFERDVAALGAGNGSRIVCYDAAGLFSAARCWWMFKIFGHDSVAVLDGGLPKWQREGHALESGPVQPAAPGLFKASFRGHMVRSMDEVAQGLAAKSIQVADARSGLRFRGEEPEPRAGVRPGHMPGAHNVHYASLLNADGTLKTPAALAEAFAGAGISTDKPIVTSCGSGVTAAILTLALSQLGARDHALYDGSWSEWGASNKDVATG